MRDQTPAIEISRHGDDYRLESRLWVPRPLDEVWPFFADASNLEQMTPDFLRFSIATPTPIEMGVGAIIDYRIRVHGLPMRWRTEIAEWDPPHGFADTQIRGPYRYWYHRHLFVENGAGTDCIDRLEYRLPFGWLGRVAHALLVKRDVQAIFGFRARVLAGLFGERERATPQYLRQAKPISVPVSGAVGR